MFSSLSLAWHHHIYPGLYNVNASPKSLAGEYSAQVLGNRQAFPAGCCVWLLLQPDLYFLELVTCSLPPNSLWKPSPSTSQTGLNSLHLPVPVSCIFQPIINFLQRWTSWLLNYSQLNFCLLILFSPLLFLLFFFFCSFFPILFLSLRWPVHPAFLFLLTSASHLSQYSRILVSRHMLKSVSAFSEKSNMTVHLCRESSSIL